MILLAVNNNLERDLEFETDSDTETSSTMANGTRRLNLDGIADVLLALDKIEQNEELAYEQLLALEANLFLGGLNLYDQHRDMRLDIDNMSYEELLALEEKMSTVSTTLSKEELSKSIRKKYISVCAIRRWKNEA
ncbi:hypothetical protein L1887_38478 [Cichorium endivia]|nr:hypothetical protein L1887_38478 [Cichorium endivia]